VTGVVANGARPITEDTHPFPTCHCERNGADVDVEVDAIEEWTGEALPVALDRAGAAGAFAGARIEPATRAGIGRGDEQERGGELEGAVDAIDRDGALLELVQSLDRRARELGELIEEQNAVMGERDLAGARRGAVNDQRGGGDRVMRGAKRPCVDEARGEAQGRVDLGGLERLGDARRGP